MCRVVKLSLFALVAAAPVGCDVLFPGRSETGSPQLKRFESAQELSSYFHTQIRARNGGLPDFDRALSEAQPGGDDADAGAGDAPPQAAPTEADGEEFSGTTTQEQGVDEADVVKTDGEYFYMLDTRFDGTSILRIVRASPVDQMTVVSETEIEGFGQDLYLRGNKVVAITSGGGIFIYFGGGGIAEDGVVVEAESGSPADVRQSDEPVSSDGDPGDDVDSGGGDGGDPDIGIAPPFGEGDYEYERPYTVVTIVDITDRAAPSISSSTRFDGTPNASRMIEGNLHLVLANYQAYYYDVLPMLGRPELVVADVDVSTLLPDYEKVGADGSTTGGDLVTWENLYRPTDPDGFGVVTVVSMDTDSPDAEFSSVGIVAEPGLIYSSTSALYLTDTNYNFEGDQRSTTDIYKFAYDGARATPVATGSVPGRILNQYSMGEHGGNLRVATTVDPVFFFDVLGGFESTEPVNAIYVLSQADDDLSIIGRAEGLAEGETIQSARFTGNRGYLVTFRQIDPLFTIDLSDPTNPQIVGELHVPGFSTFLTPMDENHVLAVGQYVPPPGEFGGWGVQLSIFDVSDFANPVRSANVVIGGEDSGSYSEALWNPKAFTYFAERGVVALPVSIYGGFFIEDDVRDIFDEDVAVEGDSGVSSGDGGEPDAPPPTEPGDDPVVDEPTDPVVPEGFEGLVVFSVSAEDGLTELGRISTRFEEAGFYYPSFTRGVFIGDRVYAVTNVGLRVAPLSDISLLQNELFYGEEFIPPFPEPLPGDPGVVEPEPGEVMTDPVNADGTTGG
jgi:uncharacterized secreted protein with C-terminal beta-propeller domain